MSTQIAYLGTLTAMTSFAAWQLPTYVRGALVQSTMNFFSDAAQTIPADPTGTTAQVLRGDGIVTTYTYGTGAYITRDSVGVFHVLVDTTPANGEWRVRWLGTGVVQTAYEDVWVVVSGA